jgi:hypothetical protein
LPTRGLVEATLSSKEITELDRMEIAKINFVRRTIEEKVLSAWRKLVSGEEFGEDELRHANALLNLSNRTG